MKENNQALEDLELIDSCLVKNFFMRNLEIRARFEVIKQMSLCMVKKETVVFNQATIGNFFYIIKQGRVDLFINDIYIKTIKAGESFGDLALLHNALRSGTIKASEDTYLWCLQRNKFRKVVDYINKESFEENKKFLASIPILNNMENEHKVLLCQSIIPEAYDPGASIVKAGDPANCLYIIKEGSVVCLKKGEVIRTLNKGDFFGEKSILIDSNRTLDVNSKTTCVVLSISIETLTKVVGEGYRDVLFLNFIKMTMNKAKYFSKFNNNTIEKTYPAFKIKNHLMSDVVVKKGYETSKRILLIMEGNLMRMNVIIKNINF